MDWDRFLLYAAIVDGICLFALEAYALSTGTFYPTFPWWPFFYHVP
jgi:hypothetical protein